jgi:thioredoxin 1
LAPILEQLKTKKGQSLRILKIDVDKNKSLSVQFQIRSVPTLILFKDGKSVWRQSGVVPATTLEGIIKQYV